MRTRHATFLAGLLAASLVLPGGAAAQETAPSLDEAANAVIQGIFDRPIRLVDGLYEGQAFVEGGAQRPRVTMARTLSLTGDFDADGRADRAIFLTHDGGGTGRFVYLALLTATGMGPENTLTVAIGDRVHVHDLSFDDGVLTVGMVGHGPADPGCCASHDMEVRVTAEDGELIARESVVRGRALPAMLDGTAWRLARFDWDAQPVDEEIEITLEVADGRVAGVAACNRYFADIVQPEDPEPLALEFEAIGVTRMACPEPRMTAEDRFLDRLAGAEAFNFEFGDLVILYATVGENGAMVLTRQE
ncbi:MAG: META domain-containing protein [Azospirillaceae bacterium]